MTRIDMGVVEVPTLIPVAAPFLEDFAREVLKTVMDELTVLTDKEECTSTPCAILRIASTCSRLRGNGEDPVFYCPSLMRHLVAFKRAFIAHMRPPILLHCRRLKPPPLSTAVCTSTTNILNVFRISPPMRLQV